MQEIWIDVPHYEGHYQVSNTGKIKSLKTRNGRILKSTPDRNSIPRVGLRRYERTKFFYVHRLVYCAFHNLKLTSDLCVVHRDHNSLNNHLSNLMVLTHKQAARHINC